MNPPIDPQEFLKSLTTRPGIYQMINDKDQVLYVGKAKNIKKRVTSYFQREKNIRLANLVKQIHHIDIIVTKTETEALLLENNLIKKLKPRYNILFRDDKSYPYIFLSSDENYPRLDFHRGAKSKKGCYFGPYPSSGAVRQSLHLLQKLFQIRQCSDTFFRNRSRPCIQYQIKRCSAPCVALISPEDYKKNVDLAQLFLQGKNKQLINQFIKKMEQASQQLSFEEAAKYRDQIQSLRQIQEQQHVIGKGGNMDVIAAVVDAHQVCVQVLFVRAGRIIGNHNFFSHSALSLSAVEVLHKFIPQFYLRPQHQRDIPAQILVNCQLTEKQGLEMLLAESSDVKVKIAQPMRGEKSHWLQMAVQNAEMALKNRVALKANYVKRLQALQHSLNLPHLPQRMECFDVSHSMGEATVASCVVFNQEGPDNHSYRRFNIKTAIKGDDYGAMREALHRRYLHLKKTGNHFPDIILVDGGKGQLHEAEKVMEQLQIPGIILLAIAKGPGRKAGLEIIFKSGSKQAIQLAPDSLALHVLQQIRDEAHRFAITGHKQQRDKARTTSFLENIAGVGAKRRRQLLQYFGGLQGVQQASLEQLQQVPGINRALAKKIFDYIARD